jgi:hypothetical protein
VRSNVAVAVMVSMTAAAAAEAPAPPSPAAVARLLDAQKAAMLRDEGNDDEIKRVLVTNALISIQRDLMTPYSIDRAKPVVGWTGACGWVAVEATIRARTHPEMQADGAPPVQPPRRWHWLELVEADGSAYLTPALALYATSPDSALGNGLYNDIKDLPTEPVPSQLTGWLGNPAEAAKHLAADPAVTVYGTSADDRAVGPAAAKQLLASWSKLKLDVVTAKPKSTDHEHHELAVGDCRVASAYVRMRYQDGALLLRGFAIAHQTAAGLELVALAYATDNVY